MPLTRPPIPLGDRHIDSHFADLVERVSQRHWSVADRCCAQFLQAFEQQMQTEEDLMFPALQKSLGTRRGPVADLRADHDHMRALARRVAATLAERDAEAFFEGVIILRAMLDQHRLKEAGIVHPIVDSFTANPDTLPLPSSCKPGGRAPHGKRRANMKAALALLAMWVGMAGQPAAAGQAARGGA
jgi:hypothetical protein